MELSILKHPELVIALDIGSTYSGYAWQSRGEFEGNRNNINFNTNWGGGALQLHKTKTCIYIHLKPEDPSSEEQKETQSKFTLEHANIETVKIGHEAEKVYMSISKKKRHDEIVGKYYLFSRFKMRLYEKGFHNAVTMEDQISQQLPLLDVMALFIKTLKDHCLNKISNVQGITVNINKTLFVVTVPAIWSDEAKGFMRTAAIQAGIGKKNVLLALEPEAAAISCIHLPKQMRADMNNFGDKGQKFLVADLGGGTADLSAVEVDDKGYLKELCEPIGRRDGGENINNAFLQVCHDSFEGDQWKEIFQKATPIEMLRMEADFEQKKVTIGTDDGDAESMELAIPQAVKNGLENKTIRIKPDASVKFENNEFLFESAHVRGHLFETTMNSIYTNTIKKVLAEPKAQGISTVILVGGFVESPIVVQGIRKKISNDFPSVKVVVPNSPFKSVLEGAVIYGHDPMIFSSRISRSTYGVDTYTAFDRTKHDESTKWENQETGKFYCKDIFDIHVTKGQSVRLTDKQPVQTYYPLRKEQKAMSFCIYASESLNPKYITDEGCRKIGEIMVEMPDTTGGTTREVEVTMVYGGTELSVITTDKTTGKEFNTNIQFHTDK